MLEAAKILHALIKRVLAGMTERRMAQVVRKADGLYKRFVEMQRTCDGAGYLRDLERMRQAGSVQIAFVINEDLGFVDEPAECRGMDNPIAIALVLTAIGCRRLCEATAPTAFFVRRIRCQRFGRRIHSGTRGFQRPIEGSIIVIRGDIGVAERTQQHESELVGLHLLVELHRFAQFRGACRRRFRRQSGCTHKVR